MPQPEVTTPLETTFEGLEIDVRELEVEKINEVNNTIFSQKSPNVGIWHSVTVHYSTTNERSIVGGLFLIFKNENINSTLALSLHIKLRASGETDSDAEFVCRLIKYTYSFMADYVKENNIKDENENPFIVPVFQLDADYFRFGFPD